MKEVGRLLETQRQKERDFVAEVAAETTAPKGWTAALMMFHVARWRGRLLHAMTEHSEGRPFAARPGNIDELNDAALRAGGELSLAEASAECDAALGALIELWSNSGDKCAASVYPVVDDLEPERRESQAERRCQYKEQHHLIP